MERGRRIALVAHCVLNANARVDGLATWAGVHPVVAALAAEGIGLVQLPCPEATFAGLDREAQTFDVYDTPEFAQHCRAALIEVVEEIEAYVEHDYDVGPVIGVEASPSCGVTKVCSGSGAGRRIDGTGVLMRELAHLLDERESGAGRGVAFTAVDSRDEDGGVARVIDAL